MSIAENNLRNGSASRRSLSLQALSKRELRRRIWHMIPGLLVLPLNVVPHADPLSPTLRFIILAAALISAGLIYMRFRQIRRHEHDQGTAAVAGYAGAVLLTVLLLPDRLEVGLGVLAILAFGDGSATAVGKLFAGPALPWNRQKSFAGLLGFIAAGGTATTLMYWGETHNPEATEPPLTLVAAFLLTFPAVFLSALVESLNSRINDNIRVGIVAAVSLAALSLLR